MQLWRGDGPFEMARQVSYKLLILQRLCPDDSTDGEWCARRDLNPQPPDPKSDALSN